MRSIAELIEEQEKNGGIDVTNLDAGTTIIVDTLNTRYTICVKSSDGPLLEITSKKLNDKGGKYFTSPTLGYLNGSTFGGSLIKPDWIGRDMCMELIRSGTKRIVRTSLVQSAEVIGVGEAWRYKLWE